MEKSKFVSKIAGFVLKFFVVMAKAISSLYAMVVIWPSSFGTILGTLEALFSDEKGNPVFIVPALLISSSIVLFWIFWWFWPSKKWKKAILLMRIFCIWAMLLFLFDFYKGYDPSYHNARVRFFETWKIEFYRNLLQERGGNVSLVSRATERNGLFLIQRFFDRISWESRTWTGDLIKISEKDLKFSASEMEATRKLLVNNGDSGYLESEEAFVFKTDDPKYAIVLPLDGKEYSILDRISFYGVWVVFGKENGLLIVRWCRRDLLCSQYY